MALVACVGPSSASSSNWMEIKATLAHAVSEFVPCSSGHINTQLMLACRCRTTHWWRCATDAIQCDAFSVCTDVACAQNTAESTLSSICLRLRDSSTAEVRQLACAIQPRLMLLWPTHFELEARTADRRSHYCVRGLIPIRQDNQSNSNTQRMTTNSDPCLERRRSIPRASNDRAGLPSTFHRAPFQSVIVTNVWTAGGGGHHTDLSIRSWIL